MPPDVDASRAARERLPGGSFGPPVPELGNAGAAGPAGGGRVGVRAPMRESEDPVVRPPVPLLVDDLEAGLAAVTEVGGQVAPPFELPGQGTFAVDYVLAGIQHRLWQL